MVKPFGTKSQVLKLQWPLVGSEVLIYSEDRSIFATCSTDFFQGPVRTALMNDKKIFVDGFINSKNQLVINHVIEPDETGPFW